MFANDNIQVERKAKNNISKVKVKLNVIDNLTRLISLLRVNALVFHRSHFQCVHTQIFYEIKFVSWKSNKNCGFVDEHFSDCHVFTEPASVVVTFVLHPKVLLVDLLE